MKLLLALLVVSHSAFAIDTGDGSDGVCNITGGADTQITSARKLYQCSSLNIDANLDDFSGSQAGAGGAALVIKVQGNVTVGAGVTIDLSGDNGIPGTNAAGVIAGGAAGAGGFSGGSSPGQSVDGQNGNGAGGGFKGLAVPMTAVFSYGGGGGGGSYKTQGATLAQDGEDIGVGTDLGSGGAQGFVNGNEAAFDSIFVGGSGGAAGGGAQENGQPDISGSSGGGGGGAIRIIAGGDIIVDGSIISKGGDGGGTGATNYAGSGGGGSGGAIWLQAGGNLTVSGMITSLGGNPGSNSGGYSGGSGGDGRIRLDDGDGVINIIGGSTISPAPYSTSFTPTPLTSGSNAIGRQYASGVSCASVALDDYEKPYNNLMNLILGIAVVALTHYSLSKKSKV